MIVILDNIQYKSTMGHCNNHEIDEYVESKEHYTYQTKLLISMFNTGQLPEVENIIVEPRFGYVASINYRDGGTRILYGHDPGFNSGSSEQLAKDKGYSKFMLRKLGINCPNGDEFLLPWWAETLRQSDRHIGNAEIRTTDQADSYIQNELGYPIYAKPVSGSQGSGVQKIFDKNSLNELFGEYNSERVKVALVEEALDMPDYRLLIFDGELVNAYERQPFLVTGDGSSNINSLIDNVVADYIDDSRDIKVDKYRKDIIRKLARHALTLQSVLHEGEKLPLLDISNLSAGGIPIDVSNDIHPHWVDIARNVTQGFNLRICGVDLACSDITSSDSDYSVIEVNATPGAKQFMASGEVGREKLEALFCQFFRTQQ